MNGSIAPKPANEDADAKLKIYFLPNLLTAGNLFCGFVALTKIVEADPLADDYFGQIKLALGFILLACIFDLLDGRVARLGGTDIPFGREFDSLADLVSFGVAPAFLVQRVVLADVFGEHRQISWFIASIYLLCGAFRMWERPRFVTQICIRRLQVYRNRIMNAGLNSRGCQCRLQFITIFGAQRVNVIHVPPPRHFLRRINVAVGQ